MTTVHQGATIPSPTEAFPSDFINQIIHGDALSVLKSFPNNSIDALVTDPPAGIHFMNMEFDSDKGGRKQWIAWLTSIMAEVLRVLKPGGHALVWALPRTSHWTAWALEDAGFTLRDCCYHIQGAGFPKSLDISKALDKMQEAEREYAGPKVYADGTKAHISNKEHEGRNRPWKHDYEAVQRHDNLTAPATPEAQQWEGWGTALKPAVECWWLCRKPLSESSIAANMLKWGTGGLNVDATRIGTTRANAPQYRPASPSGIGYEKNCYGTRDGKEQVYTEGRFPSHLLLSHSIFCTPNGTKQIHSNGGLPGNPIAPKTKNTYGQFNHQSLTTHRNETGMETVEDWICDPSCPILHLDQQSGERKSGGGIKAKAGSTIGFLRGEKNYHFRHDSEPCEPSEGTASRYFTQLHPLDELDIPFRYTPKAAREERNAGLYAFPYVPSGTYGEFAGDGRGRQTEHSPEKNNHPTVKPISLMRWLVRLITPPHGIVLDCFAGSGSTLVACVKEGFRFVGIEQDRAYCEIARARVDHAQGLWRVESEA